MALDPDVSPARKLSPRGSRVQQWKRALLIPCRGGSRGRRGTRVSRILRERERTIVAEGVRHLAGSTMGSDRWCHRAAVKHRRGVRFSA